jgi:hypothetical protein
MRSLPGPERKDALLKVGILCRLLYEGVLSEDEIAGKLGFRSAEVLHIQMRNWKLPDWIVEPKSSSEKAEQAGMPKNEGNKRKAQSSRKADELPGKAEELPAASRALPLFAKDLERLNNYMKQLPNLVEKLVERRFVSYLKMDMRYQAALETYLSRVHGFDGLLYHSSAHPEGATAKPWEGLYFLIVIHALMNESVDSLIDALHPRAHEVDRAELYKKRGYIGSMKTEAENLAKTVRGLEVKKGQIPGEVSDEEARMYWLQIHPRVEQGYSNTEIYEELKKHFLDEENKFRGEKYTLEDIKRLRGLNLQPPPDFEIWFPNPPPPSNSDPPPPFE